MQWVLLGGVLPPGLAKDKTMFEIKVSDVDVSAGSIPVSWCLDMETIAKLSEDKVKDPQVVIITAPVNNYHVRKESRKVVPLKDLMAYVEFKSSGPNKIWAFISTRGREYAKDTYLSRRGGEYITDILDNGGDEWSVLFAHTKYDENGEYAGRTKEPDFASIVDVEVPAGVFAAEPSQWEKNWVNHFFKEKCVDQCDFRRRRLFAYTLQPVIILLQQVIRLAITLLSAAILSKGFSFKPLLNPLAMDMDDTWDLLRGGSLFVRELREDKEYDVPKTTKKIISYCVRKFLLVPFLPIIVIPVVLLALFKPVGLAIFSSAFIVILLGLLLVAFIGGGAAKQFIKKVLDLLSDEPAEAWYLNQEEITLLTCNPEKKPLTFNTLPAKKQSLKLRFLNLKSKVCRPFSA